MVLNFKDNLIVVTGAARGIGEAVAYEFAKAGARIILLDVLEKVHETGDALKKAGHTGA